MGDLSSLYHYSKKKATDFKEEIKKKGLDRRKTAKAFFTDYALKNSNALR